MIQNNEKLKNAKLLFLKGEYQNAANIFLEMGMSIEHAYCVLHGGNFEEAYELISKMNPDTSIIHWAKVFTQILFKRAVDLPSPFQIRNFLEIDLSLLLKNSYFDQVETILNYSDFFSSINAESYKYCARALFTQGYPKLALEFVEFSKRLIYKDPEIHFIEGQCHESEKNAPLAQKAFQKALETCPGYYPAIMMLKQ